MQLYSASSKRFQEDVENNAIAEKLAARFIDEYFYEPPDGEVKAWRNSLAAMAGVLDGASLYDHGVLVEFQLPLTSRRLDCMITGRGAQAAGAVVVELKQWDYVLPSWVDECVCT